MADRHGPQAATGPATPSAWGEEPGPVAQHQPAVPPPAGPTHPAGPPPAADPDAPHDQPNLSYIPALDGIRAFAVLGVMAFHGGIPWLAGGYLGVDAFFVLSGFLITSLLLNEWQRIRTIRLGAFWARRARRLLPALLLVLLFVACYAAFVVPAGTYPGLRLDSLSTLFYVANWHFILVGSNYFNQTGLPSPLTHTWSLAIEEQFYLVWPLVVLGLLKLTRNLRVLLVVSVLGALASATEMALLYHPGTDTTRLYYGTDTHAQCLLVGASLAVSLALLARERARRAAEDVAAARAVHRRGAHLRPPGGDPGWAATTVVGRVVLTVVGFAGVAGLAVMWWRLTGGSSLLYRGGFLLASVATAAVLVSVVCAQRSPLARLLSVTPLRYLGRISYSLYLWHYPLFIWINGTRTGLTGYPLFVVRAAATVAVATVSFYAVERPIRQGTFFRQWRAWVVTPVAVAVTVVALVAATMVPAVADVGVGPAPDSSLYKGPPVKALLIGDSTAVTLGLGLSEVDKTYDVTEQDQGIIGCGVTVGTQYVTKGTEVPFNQPCNSNPPPPGTPQLKTTATPYGVTVKSPDAERWTVWYTNWVDKFDPNVVMVLAGRWEVVTRTYEGKSTNILAPAFAAYVKDQLQHTVALASAKGARVVLLTAPCYATGEQPDGQPWSTNSLARLDAYNGLLRQVAAEDPTTVSVLDLSALACPDGHYQQAIDGVPLRTSDGVHFTITGGKYLAPKIWPTVVKVGREQMAATDPEG